MRRRGRMHRTALAAGTLLVALGLAGDGRGYTPIIFFGTTPVRWSPGLQPLSMFTDAFGSLRYGPQDSRDEEAILETAEIWNGVEGSSFRFDLQVRATRIDRFGNQLVDGPGGRGRFVFFDNEGDDIRAFVGPAISRVVGITTFAFNGNNFRDADVALNSFSFDFDVEEPPAPGRFSLRGVASHELGHALGLNHSGSAGSNMFPFANRNGIASAPSFDDQAGIASLYPGAGGEAFGGLRGILTGPFGRPFGVQVVALDAQGVVQATAVTLSDGRYDLRRLPPGDYTLYVEPLDGPMSAVNLGGVLGGPPTPTPTLMLAGGDAGPPVEVSAGVLRTDVHFVYDERAGSLNPTGYVQDRGATRLVQGRSKEMTLIGNGIAGAAGPAEVFLSGPGMHVEVLGISPAGNQRLDVRLTAAPEAAPGPHTLFVQRGEEIAAFTGGVVVFENSPPQAAFEVPSAVACSSPAGARLELDGSASRDFDSIPGTDSDLVAHRWFSRRGGTPVSVGEGETQQVDLPFGKTDLILEVEDLSGAISATERTVEVKDLAPPAVFINPDVTHIWPPDGRIVSIDPRVVAWDTCQIAVQRTLEVEILDDCADPGAAKIDSRGRVQVLAESCGKARHRVYRIAFTGTDDAGNSATAEALVRVAPLLDPATEAPSVERPSRLQLPDGSVQRRGRRVNPSIRPKPNRNPS